MTSEAVYRTERVTLYHGNSLDVLAELDDETVDSIVTDPPYELGFMGKKWDASGIAYSVDLWAECLRVLKPGGHLLAFGGTRTYHRMTVAIEDAGFEIRDSIHWLYGSGFPKSHDVSKAIDKQAGAERQVIGSVDVGPDIRGGNYENADGRMIANITAPATDAAREWEGWGTALKPAHEPIVLARKPFYGTVAANVLEHGTGALNIDGCRIPFTGDENLDSVQRQQQSDGMMGSFSKSKIGKEIAIYKPGGRWPANVILDEFAGAELDRQSGITKDGVAVNRNRTSDNDRAIYSSYQFGNNRGPDVGYGGKGGASRFFYCAKASRAERDAGLHEISISPRNIHPTVKPLALMRYLVRLVTPPDGIVLDPFAGSGTTLAAAIIEGFRPIGIELTDDYLPIIIGRCEHAAAQTETETVDDDTQLSFDW